MSNMHPDCFIPPCRVVATLRTVLSNVVGDELIGLAVVGETEGLVDGFAVGDLEGVAVGTRGSLGATLGYDSVSSLDH